MVREISTASCGLPPTPMMVSWTKVLAAIMRPDGVGVVVVRHLGELVERVHRCPQAFEVDVGQALWVLGGLAGTEALEHRPHLVELGDDVRTQRAHVIDYTGGPTFGGWLEEHGATSGQLVYTEKAGVNTIVVDSTDNLRGVLGNLAFSLTLYSGQMCTTPQNIYVPREGITTEEGQVSFEDFGTKLAAAVGKLTGDDARAVELLGATVNDGVRANAAGLAALAEEAGGTVVLDSREVTHPAYPDAVVRAPGLVSMDASREDVYTQECFGPVTFLIGTSGTDQSLAQFRDTVREHGAMTAAVYSTSEDVLDAARDAAADAGVALSENLTGPVFVNQTAAFSDYHGTGGNPAANSAYVDAAFVANRFRVVTSRRHV